MRMLLAPKRLHFLTVDAFLWPFKIRGVPTLNLCRRSLSSAHVGNGTLAQKFERDPLASQLMPADPNFPEPTLP